MKLIKIAVALCALAMCVNPMPAEAKKKTTTSTSTTSTSKVNVDANLELAQELIDRGNYDRAKDLLNQVVTVAPNNAKALELLGTCNMMIQAKINAERNNYNNACNIGTDEALNEFLNDYPKSPLCPDVRNRIEDNRRWRQASANRNRTAVENYMATTKYKTHAAEAKEIIDSYKQEDDWKVLQQNPSKEAYENYLALYPNSPHNSEVNYHLNLIHADEYFNNDDFEHALQCFETARRIKRLPDNMQADYQTCLNYKRFSSLGDSDLSGMQSFLASLTPDNPLYGPTSDKIALAMARSLSKFSTNEQMNEPFNYAKSDYAMQTVQSIVNKAKDERKAYNDEIAAIKRKEWWHHRVAIGLDLFEFEFGSKMFCYTGGLKVRFGRHNSVANIIVGATYTCVSEDFAFSSDEQTSFSTIAHLLNIPVGLQFNIPTGHETRFYLGGEFDYGYRVQEGNNSQGLTNSSTMAWKAKLGLTRHHYEFGAFVKKYLNGHNVFTDEVINILGEDYNKMIYGLNWTIYF